MSSQAFEDILARIHQTAGTRTQVQIAEVLDIRQSSISDAKRRGSIPADWILKLFRKFGVHPNWLETGVGPVYLDPQLAKIPASEIEALSPKSGPSWDKPTAIPCHLSAAYDLSSPDKSLIGMVSLPAALKPTTAFAVRYEPSDMGQLVPKGSLVGVKAKTEGKPTEGELCALAYPGAGLLIRRAFFDPANERWILRAEDGQSPELSLKGSDLVPIVGRVAWVLAVTE